jgi:hypothetical protein
MTHLPPFSPEIRDHVIGTIQHNRQSIRRTMFLTANRARLREGCGIQDNQALITMHMTMLGPMFQTKIRRDRELKHTTIAMMNAATLVRRVFVIAMSLVSNDRHFGP